MLGGGAQAGDCLGEFGSATGVPADGTVVLNPGGGDDDPFEQSLVVFTNGPDSEPATITVCEVPENLHPGPYGYIAIERNLTIEVTFEQNDPDNEDTYLARVMMPFAGDELPVGPVFLGPEATELTYFNLSAWALAVSANTLNSPGFGEAVGDRFTVIGTTQPAEFSDEIGDYGIFWHTDALRGFVWANVDHATDFAPGAPVCRADLDGDGIVGIPGLLILLGEWGPCVDPPVGCQGDIFVDGLCDVWDLALLLAFWGNDCFLPPDVAGILHSITSVENLAGNSEWGDGAAGNTHRTWDLQITMDPDDIGDWWTTTESLATLDDPAYTALTFYQHPSDELWESAGEQPGAPPYLDWCVAFEAAAFDSWYIEATDGDPCTWPDPLPGATLLAPFTETDTGVHATWYDQLTFAPPGPGADPFTVARYTILIDVEDADCPDCHLDIDVVASDQTGSDPVLGTIEGLTAHRFGLSNLIPYSFDVIDRCAADINDDGCVDIIDFLALLAAWPGRGTPADIDRDGAVGVVDFLRLLARWGPCTPDDVCPAP